MNDGENQYWPFAVLAPELRTESHRAIIAFLEAADRAGYRPYRFGSANYGATSADRGGEIFDRGRRGGRWEIVLGQAGGSPASAHVDGFDVGARALLDWLDGADVGAIEGRIHLHRIEDGAAAIAEAARRPG